MVRIVEGIQQILMEWVDVGETRKAVEDGGEFLGEGGGGVLDFADVEGADAGDFEAGADLGGQAALGA